MFAAQSFRVYRIPMGSERDSPGEFGVSVGKQIPEHARPKIDQSSSSKNKPLESFRTHKERHLLGLLRDETRLVLDQTRTTGIDAALAHCTA